MALDAKKYRRSSSDPLMHLFAADNPFRRKPQQDAVRQQPSSVSLSETPTLKTEKRPPRNPKSEDTPNIAVDAFLDKKPIDPVDENVVDTSRVSKRKKRKRDELEKEYEQRKYGDVVVEPEPVVGKKRKADKLKAEIKTSSPRKESFDDEEKLLRTVFVGNLPVSMTRKSLTKEFKRFGVVESTRIRSVPLADSRKPRKAAIMEGKLKDAADSVNAYIVFKDEQSAHAALSHNMTEIDGKHIRVDMACPPRKKLKGETPMYDRKKTVFVGNLPFDVKAEELYELFHGIIPEDSGIEGIRVIRDPSTSLGKGIAYVLFKTRDAANKVVRMKDLKLKERPLRVFHASVDPGPVSKPSKRNQPSPPRRQRDFPNKKPVYVRTRGSSPGSDSKPKTKAGNPSYQGLRASKTGVVKKAGPHPHPISAPSTSGDRGTKRYSSPSPKVREAKRPAVAARKAKYLMKRKQEAGTPEGAHRTKKAKHQ